MSFRTIVISKQSKLSYKNRYLVVKQELEELYKYALFNKINIILIDSNNTGITLKNEKKLIIDKDLTEYMLQ